MATDRFERATSTCWRKPVRSRRLRRGCATPRLESPPVGVDARRGPTLFARLRDGDAAHGNEQRVPAYRRE